MCEKEKNPEKGLEVSDRGSIICEEEGKLTLFYPYKAPVKKKTHKELEDLLLHKPDEMSLEELEDLLDKEEKDIKKLAKEFQEEVEREKEKAKALSQKIQDFLESDPEQDNEK